MIPTKLTYEEIQELKELNHRIFGGGNGIIINSPSDLTPDMKRHQELIGKMNAFDRHLLTLASQSLEKVISVPTMQEVRELGQYKMKMYAYAMRTKTSGFLDDLASEVLGLLGKERFEELMEKQEKALYTMKLQKKYN